MSNLAVVVAHPDDEVLAFGGLMARQRARGDDVSVLIMATGLTSRDGAEGTSSEALEELRNNARAANQMLGVDDLTFATFPDNKMDSVAMLDVVKRVEEFLTTCKATVVYTHHPYDLNVDHAVVAQAVMTATRPLPGSSIKEVFAGEVLSSSEFSFPERRFVPQIYHDITGFVDQKCAALECYSGEIRDWPHPRSVDAIRAAARLRGSECGLEAAEALSVLRAVYR